MRLTSCHSLSSVEPKPGDVRTPGRFRSWREGRGFEMPGDFHGPAALPGARAPGELGKKFRRPVFFFLLHGGRPNLAQAGRACPDVPV